MIEDKQTKQKKIMWKCMPRANKGIWIKKQDGKEDLFVFKGLSWSRL